MTESKRFQDHLSSWHTALGNQLESDPLEATVVRAKWAILSDVTAGVIPRSVKSFAELHDFVDANGYGDAFSWPELPSDSDDAAYVAAHCEFWNEIQNRLHVWIATGSLRNELISQNR
jgi:hypothetical protein